MGDVLFELEQSLRSKQDKMTSQEANVLMTCKAKAIRALTVGAGAGAGITWLASRRLSSLLRFNLSGGAALFFGAWKFRRSIHSCIEHIFDLDGTRMQKELAIIMLQKYGDSMQTMQLISKYFYSEEVYDDSSSEQPKLRWRYRNNFVDSIAHSQRTHDSYSYEDKMDAKKPDPEKTDLKPKQVSMNPCVGAIANPFDCVLGLPARVEEIRPPVTSGTTSGRQSRSHKRSRRKHRMQHKEVTSNSEDV